MTISIAAGIDDLACFIVTQYKQFFLILVYNIYGVR